MSAQSIAWRVLLALTTLDGGGGTTDQVAADAALKGVKRKAVDTNLRILCKRNLVKHHPEVDIAPWQVTQAGVNVIADGAFTRKNAAAGAIPRAGAGKAPPAKKKTRAAKPSKKSKPAKKKAPKKTHRTARPAPASEPSAARFWLSDEVGLRIEADGCTGDLSPAATQRLAEFVFRHFDHEAAA